jgi:hypothetical protein
MKKTTSILISSLAIFFAVFALSGSANAKKPVPIVFSGGTWATTTAFNIFQPTPTQPPVDSAGESRSIVLNKTIVYNIRINRRVHETRAERINRVFGHRYPGFVKQYSGPKYPF